MWHQKIEKESTIYILFNVNFEERKKAQKIQMLEKVYVKKWDEDKRKRTQIGASILNLIKQATTIYEPKTLNCLWKLQVKDVGLLSTITKK